MFNFNCMAAPDKNLLFPLPAYNRLCFLKNLINNPNIIVGDYTYYDDFENVANFEKNVKYHFDFIGDKLIIGKFCMIAADVQFIMNGANHLSNAVSAYPFAIFGADWQDAMAGKTYPTKGDTIVGNDVWIGHRATILPGVHIGDGAIIGAYALVTKDVEPYTIVGGNPAKLIKKRFSEEQIAQLLKIEWWNWEADTITQRLHLLTDDNIDAFIQQAGEV
ncbi:MAG: hypothetical protein RLY16_2905 [Bacteroidota bacterium]|jgi:virginiamycin A acetyltransferase